MYQKRTKTAVFGVLIVALVITTSTLTVSLPVFLIQCFSASFTIPLVLRKDYRTAKAYFTIYLVSLVFVFLVFFANQANSGSPYYIGGSDDLMFEQQAVTVYYSNLIAPSSVLTSGVIGRYHNSVFFVVYISLLIRFAHLFGGYNTFLPRILNVYYLLWSCLILEYLLQKYVSFSGRRLRLSILLFAITPNIQYINSHVFRDSLNLLQILLIVFLFDKVLESKKHIKRLFYLVALVFLIYITYYTRKNSLVFASAICLLMLAERFNIRKILLGFALIPIVFFTGFLETIRLEFFIKNYSAYVQGIAGEGLSRFVFRYPLLPFGIILRTFYALITPFPDFLGLFRGTNAILYDLMRFLIYVGVVIQILFIPFILKRVFKIDWLTISCSVLFLGVIATTFTFRHVMLYYPFLVAMAIDGYYSTSRRARGRIFVWSAFLGICAALIYVSLKFL